MGDIKTQALKKKGDTVGLKEQEWGLTENYSGEWFRLAGNTEDVYNSTSRNTSRILAHVFKESVHILSFTVWPTTHPKISLSEENWEFVVQSKRI